MASARVCKQQHVQQDGVLVMLATNRVQVAEEWQQVVQDTEGADVLERCKRLNEFLSQDFSRLKGDSNTQKELQTIMAMLKTERRQRPACLNEKTKPVMQDKPPSKRHSLADSAASVGRQALNSADDDDALEVLSILQQADTTAPQIPTSAHRISCCSTGSSMNGSSRPSTGQQSVMSSASHQPDHDLSDLIGMLNPSSAPGKVLAGHAASHTPVTSCTSATLQAPQAAACSASRAAGALAVRQLQDKLKAQRADAGTAAAPVVFKALTVSVTRPPAAAKQAEMQLRGYSKAEADAAASKAADAAAKQAAAQKAAIEAAARNAADEAAAKQAAAQAAAEAAAKKAAAEAAAKKIAAEAARKAAEAASQAAAAIVLQCCWRTHAARWYVSHMHAAATCLASAVRCHQACRQLQQLRTLWSIRQNIMARRIQRAWRTWHITRGWRLGEVRGRTRAGSADKAKVVSSSTAATPVKVRSTADTRLAPPVPLNDGQVQGLQHPDHGSCRRAVSTTQTRSVQVAQQEQLRKQDLGTRVMMTASMHRNTQEAMAIATQRHAPNRQLSLQHALQE